MATKRLILLLIRVAKYFIVHAEAEVKKCNEEDKKKIIIR